MNLVSRAFPQEINRTQWSIFWIIHYWLREFSESCWSVSRSVSLVHPDKHSSFIDTETMKCKLRQWATYQETLTSQLNRDVWYVSFSGECRVNIKEHQEMRGKKRNFSWINLFNLAEGMMTQGRSADAYVDCSVFSRETLRSSSYM